jgi:hypothetical protein
VHYYYKVKDLERGLAEAQRRVEDVAARREAWVRGEMDHTTGGDFGEARERLRRLKSEQQRVRRHKRRFVDSDVVSE